MKITWSGFRGENRALHPIMLPETLGTVSLNQNPSRGDLRPWKAPLAVATVPASRQSIYRMGRDVVSDTQYWLSWNTPVHAVRGFVADDTTERTYYTGDGFPKWTDNVLGLASAPYPTAWRQLGVPKPATPPLLSASGGTSAVTENRFYVYTYVTDKGEEGVPSPVSAMLVCKTDATVSISSLATVPSGSFGINRIRVYRTQTGLATDSAFLRLTTIDSTLTSTTDTGQALGGALATTTWLAPPADLTGLTGLWNGMMAGVSGNSVRVCEAFTPYAWPIAYDIVPPNAKPVALAKVGQSMLVLTTGRPVLVTGGSPDSLEEQPLEIAEACVSARSVVSFGHGAVWASPDGLAYYGAGGSRMITNGIMTRDDWQAINPASIVASAYEGAYLGFYTVAGVTKGFLINPVEPTGMFFMDFPASAVFFDELQDNLYLLNGVQISKWDSGAAQTATARSKVFRSPKPCMMACAEVTADAYPVTFRLFADGALKHTQVVLDGNAFRLPSGFMAQNWQIEVATLGGAIQAISMAQSIEELGSV